MKLAALHARVDDDARIASLWARAEAAAPDRVVVLGAAAPWAARRAAAESAAADLRYVDDVAAYLVADPDGPPPKRPAPSLLARAAAVGPRARALELFGPYVCIVKDGPVEDDEVESAHVWIVPADKSSVQRRGEGRVVVELGADVVAVVEGADPSVSFLDAAGGVVDKQPLGLAAPTKMTVQGASR